MSKANQFIVGVLTSTAALLWLGRADAVTIWGLQTAGGSSDPSLVTFESTAPGPVTTIGSLGGGIDSFMTGLDFDGSGKLYGQEQDGDFYSVDKATGAATLIGGGGLQANYSIGDLSWDPVGKRMLAVAT